MDALFVFIAVAAALVVALTMAAACLWGITALQRRAANSLANIYAGLDLQAVQRPGDVVLLYHTYHGFLVFVVMTPHYATLPYADARRLLRRLLWFNCTWGLLAYCGLIIPVIGAINYLLQRRSIALQFAAHEHNKAAVKMPLPAEESNPYAASATIATSRVPRAPQVEGPSAPSAIFRVGGALLIGIALLSLFGCLVAAIVERTFEPLKALGGVAIIGALGWGLWQRG